MTQKRNKMPPYLDGRRIPKKGEKWIRKSFPVPTIVEIVRCDDLCVSVRREGKKPIVVSLSMFLEQGFKRIENGQSQ